MKILGKHPEGEAVYKFFSAVGILFKGFFTWAWKLDGDDIGECILGSILILLLVAIGTAFLFGMVLVCWATINVDWKWVFSVPPVIGLFAIGEVRVVKGIIGVYKDFF